MNVLVKISIVLLMGILGGRLAKVLHLPYVTGYLLGGLLIGPSFTNVITDTNIKVFSIVNEIALAAIAFNIGSEFLIEELMKVGKKIFIVTLAEVVGAVTIVFFTSYFLLHQPFELSIILASIAAATAPAATMMIIKQYNTSGPLTKTILPVVAIDDALCVMSFGIAMALAKISFGQGETSFLKMITLPFVEIFGSLILGFAIGFMLTFLANKTKTEDELLTFVLAFILAGGGLARVLHLSPILTCMMIGATLTNLMQNHRKVFHIIGKFTPPIYLFFFTLAGASLHLNSLGKLGLLGIGYILARSIGKIFGAGLGAKAMGYSNVIVKNLGFSLLPQAGVAIGLAMIAKQEVPQIGNTISTVILGGVFVFELVGPIMAKFALNRAGEIHQITETSQEVIS
ncbi:transporter, CPA2 family [Clostridium aceticum]|uniref:Transporter, CPA2 family n=1 Tax=Clostridium aceticum TaxID=84022 RepID=A0A0D8IBE4_9CLOT|nr:cation:proton antiporter [Clostridium aceticum]AKL96859.1 transporter, CPA2 family [Clostridium aceticum]KJF27600.1 sodium:proton exchanger [Clostridium aceticum]